MNRREFMQRSAVSGAALSMALKEAKGSGRDSSAPIPAGDRITVGMIGLGARAQQLLSAVFEQRGAEVVAICDAYTGRVERTLERTQRHPRVCKDYRELLADKSIDTVIIATPDH